MRLKTFVYLFAIPSEYAEGHTMAELSRIFVYRLSPRNRRVSTMSLLSAIDQRKLPTVRRQFLTDPHGWLVWLDAPQWDALRHSGTLWSPATWDDLNRELEAP